MADTLRPLSSREYQELTQMFGVVVSARTHEEDLKARLQSVPGAWRCFRSGVSLMLKAIDGALSTVGEKKLKQIKVNLKNTVVMTKVTCYSSTKQDNGYMYVGGDALDRIISRVISDTCFTCTKDMEGMRKCQLRKDLDDCYPWDYPMREKQCPFQGMLPDPDKEEET